MTNNPNKPPQSGTTDSDDKTSSQRIRELLGKAENELAPLAAPKNAEEAEAKEKKTGRYYLPYLKPGSKINLPIGSQPPSIEIVPDDDFGDLSEGKMAFSFLQSIWDSTWTDDFKKRVIYLNMDLFNY